MSSESKTETEEPPETAITIERQALSGAQEVTSAEIENGTIQSDAIAGGLSVERRSGKPTLVVLGTGFASWSLLAHIDPDLYHIIIVSPRNYFLFTPLLGSWILDKVDLRSILHPVKRLGPSVDYLQAECTGIDASERTVTCVSVEGGNTFKIEYDYLVLGTGCVNNTYGIQGVKEHALFLKDISDGREIHQRILDQFSRANESGMTDAEKKIALSFVVIGDGPAGVEFASGLSHFIELEVENEFPSLTGYASVTLLTAGEEESNAFDRNLSDYTLRLFNESGVRYMNGARVTRVLKDALLLEDRRLVTFSLLVWSTGTGPTRLIKNLDLPKDRLGRVITDEYLRVIGAKNIFAAGDCATIETNHLPSTARIAQQEGRHLARYLNAIRTGKKVRRFRERDLGLLVHLGMQSAACGIPKGKRSRLGAFLLWRSIYLSRLVPAKYSIHSS